MIMWVYIEVDLAADVVLMTDDVLEHKRFKLVVSELFQQELEHERYFLVGEAIPEGRYEDVGCLNKGYFALG